MTLRHFRIFVAAYRDEYNKGSGKIIYGAAKREPCCQGT